MDIGIVTALAIGFLTGFRHAFDPDHVVALSTVLHRDPHIRPALRTGAAWGLGHTTTLAVATVAVSALRVELDPVRMQLLEWPVAAMLVALGAWALLSSWRRIHGLRRHRHDGVVHFHVGAHAHPHSFDVTWGGYLVGLIHGLAGSGALLLLVAATLPSPLHGLLYAIIFGLGSLAGMAVVTFALAVPLLRSTRRPFLFHALTGASGLASVGLGLWIAGELIVP